jgi:hypothetical protein
MVAGLSGLTKTVRNGGGQRFAPANPSFGESETATDQHEAKKTEKLKTETLKSKTARRHQSDL